MSDVPVSEQATYIGDHEEDVSTFFLKYRGDKAYLASVFPPQNDPQEDVWIWGEQIDQLAPHTGKHMWKPSWGKLVALPDSTAATGYFCIFANGRLLINMYSLSSNTPDEVMPTLAKPQD